jgi:hypothetical protein
MSDSKYSALTKLKRPHHNHASAAGTGYRNLDIIDDAWAADKLSDDEIDETTTRGAESQISSLLEDEGEMDDGIVTAANSGSAAGGALERRRREEGRWDDLGLDLFEGGVGNNTSNTGGGGGGGGGGNAAPATGGQT